MESAPVPSPPRYEDVIYVVKEKEKTGEAFSQNASLPQGDLQASSVSALDSSSARVALNVLNTLTHFFLGAVVICSFVIAGDRSLYWRPYYYGNNFAAHIYLCVIGYVILMSQSILSFNPHGGWAHGFKHPHKKMIHVVMQVSGSCLALLGCWIKMFDGLSGSAHGIFGWFAMLLTIFSLIGGVLNYKYTERISQSRYKNVHLYLVLTTLTMAFISLCIPFAYPAMFDDDSGANLAITATVFALIGVLISGYIMKNHKTIE